MRTAFNVQERMEDLMSGWAWLGLACGTFCCVFSLMFVVFQYLNRRGGRKSAVIWKTAGTAVVVTAIACAAAGVLVRRSSAFSLAVGDHVLANGEKHAVVFGLNRDKPQLATFLYVPFTLANDGEEGLTNAKVTIQFEEDNIKGIPEDATKQRVVGSMDRSQLRRQTSEVEGLFYSTMLVPSVAAGDSLFLAEPIVAMPSLLASWLSREWPETEMTVSVTADHVAKQSYTLLVRPVPAVTMEDVATVYGSIGNRSASEETRATFVLPSLTLIKEAGIEAYKSDFLHDKFIEAKR
jgi:hypothetical protein